MHAFGRTLLRVGDVSLRALPGDDGRERYCVAEGLEPVGTYPTLEQAFAVFEAVCGAADEAVRCRQLAASGVVDLTAYRPAGAEEP